MSDQDEARHEEVRGLFIIGLLAILIGYRALGQKLVVIYQEVPHDLTALIDVTIMLWLLYGFCMVFVYSDVGKSLFRPMGNAFIKISLFTLITVSLIFAVSLYPERMPYSLSIIYIFLIFLSIMSILYSIKQGVHRIRNIAIKVNAVNVANASITLAVLVIVAIIVIPVNFEGYIRYLYAIGYCFICCYFGIAAVLFIYGKYEQ